MYRVNPGETLVANVALQPQLFDLILQCFQTYPTQIDPCIAQTQRLLCVDPLQTKGATI